ncbi:mechanosensitive ion channel family protein [Flammeovirga aprica]|uniref:Mechanosensitive ion channel family protein n=1 Tax=Flammeovirga aprica JL-4 TaxID=694437 RepID=A0A7X9P085_9BACT|nr:mechanosensitive ion channel family protein [Flammeovirga aprica]NME67161.1 mechanosensitive ion channel family protein [Flammeovirga aprica JL-4]
MTKQVFLFFVLFTISIISSIGQESDEVSSYPDDHIFYNFKELSGVEYSLSSPYHTMHTHLENLEDDNYHENVAAQAFPQEHFSLKERKKLAIELKLVYTQKGIYLNSQDLPLEKNYIDPKSKTKRYSISPRMPNIYLEKQRNGQWKYSVYSANQIHKLFQETYPSITRNLVVYTSSLQQNKGRFLGIKLWQWSTILGVLLFSYLFYVLSTWFTKQILQRVFLRLKQEKFAKIVLPKLRRPISITLLMLLWYYIIPFLLLPSNFAYVLTLVVKGVFCFYMTILFVHIADLAVIRINTFSNRSEALDANLVPIFKVIFRIVALALGILASLYLYGFDITHLVTGISFGGVALAFAAQDTIKNFIGSVMLFTDKPFEVGDWIVVKGQEGIVEEIGFRTTRIRTFANSLVNIPNGSMSDSDIDNLGKRQYRRFKTYLTIPYGTPIDQIELFIKAVKKAVEDHPTTRKDFYEVRLNNFGASALEILLYIFFECKDWSEELQGREYLMIKILRIAESMGIEFAFPTQTIHIAKEANDEATSTETN